jgi:Fe2+ or Zn2+ uptake regulation protein
MAIIPKNRGPEPREAAESAAALRRRGLRLTGPRRLVLEAVRASDAHPTAEWVHRVVCRRLPRVSLGTVYRNLRLLVAEGLLAEIPGPHARFDGNSAEHHHFTCVRCGRIVDVEDALATRRSRALSARIGARMGLRITHQRIEFYGRCPACEAKAGRAAPPAPRGRRRASPHP